MFGGKKDNKSINFIIGAVLLVVIALIAVLLFSNSRNEKNNSKNNKQNPAATEEQKIMEANKEAIKDAASKPEQSGQIIKISESDHIIGKIGAPVECIVYGDFEDPFSADFSATIKKVIEIFGEKIVVAFRNFPMTTIHNNAMEAAIASECAGDQGKFWEMHDKLFENAAAKILGSEQYAKDAKDLGLNTDKFAKCMENKNHEDDIYKGMADAGQAGVLGVPATFINGQSLPGAYQFDDFVDSGKFNRDGMKTIITRHLEKADK